MEQTVGKTFTLTNKVLFQFGNGDLLKLVLEFEALLVRYDKLQAYLHAKLLKMLRPPGNLPRGRGKKV